MPLRRPKSSQCHAALPAPCDGSCGRYHASISRACRFRFLRTINLAACYLIYTPVTIPHADSRSRPPPAPSCIHLHPSMLPHTGEIRHPRPRGYLDFICNTDQAGHGICAMGNIYMAHFSSRHEPRVASGVVPDTCTTQAHVAAEYKYHKFPLVSAPPHHRLSNIATPQPAP